MKISLWSFLFALLSASIFAQTGKVLDALALHSKILNMDRKYAIYFPPDYQISQRKYPVLYLLHGRGDDQTGWVQFGEVLNIADKAIKEGIATAMIIVMPDGNTGKQGYFNDISGNWRYEDFFFTELVPYIEKTYPVKAEKQYRAVSGLSMGGEGSFIYALHHPELFSSCCPLSAATGPASLEDAKQDLKKANVSTTDSSILSYYQRQSVLTLISSIPDSLKNSVRWYIDCGDKDLFSEGNSLVHIAMMKNHIPHEFRIRDGSHNWTYWRASLPSVLEFVSMRFRQY